MRGINESDATELSSFSLGEGFELRFIEQMPLDAGRRWSRESMVTADEILAAISARWVLSPDPSDRGAAPAQTWLIDGGPARVGIIASIDPTVLRRLQPRASDGRRPRSAIACSPITNPTRGSCYEREQPTTRSRTPGARRWQARLPGTGSTTSHTYSRRARCCDWRVARRSGRPVRGTGLVARKWAERFTRGRGTLDPGLARAGGGIVRYGLDETEVYPWRQVAREGLERSG